MCQSGAVISNNPLDSIRFIKIVVWTSKLIGNQSSSKYILHYTVTDSRQRIEFRLQPLHISDSSNKMWFKNYAKLRPTWYTIWKIFNAKKSKFPCFIIIVEIPNCNYEKQKRDKKFLYNVTHEHSVFLVQVSISYLNREWTTKCGGRWLDNF